MLQKDYNMPKVSPDLLADYHAARLLKLLARAERREQGILRTIASLEHRARDNPQYAPYLVRQIASAKHELTTVVELQLAYKRQHLTYLRG